MDRVKKLPIQFDLEGIRLFFEDCVKHRNEIYCLAVITAADETPSENPTILVGIQHIVRAIQKWYTNPDAARATIKERKFSADTYEL